MCVEWYFTTNIILLRKIVIYFLLIFYIFIYSKEFTSYEKFTHPIFIYPTLGMFLF
jgi:hypothetical protein